jgi:hypothetical protein
VTTPSTQHDGDGVVYTVAPSDLTYLLSDCRYCFYLKVVHGIRRPATPIPRVFTAMDRLQRAYFHGRSTKELDPGLPDGTLDCSEASIVSKPFDVGSGVSIRFRGTIDCAMAFDGGGCGMADFKTIDPRGRGVDMYRLQLHAYAIAFENPAPGYVASKRVTRLGLKCFNPIAMVTMSNDDFAFRTASTWIDVTRSDKEFWAYLGYVATNLLPGSPPDPAPHCEWCRMRRDGDATR